jgi:tellurite resistance protein TehA-like permease
VTTGTNFPLLDVFWTLLMFVGFVLWIWLLIFVFVDVFRSRELSGAAKAAWVILLILVPVLGVLAYIIVRGSRMEEHLVEDLGGGPRRIA